MGIIRLRISEQLASVLPRLWRASRTAGGSTAAFLAVASVLGIPAWREPDAVFKWDTTAWLRASKRDRNIDSRTYHSVRLEFSTYIGVWKGFKKDSFVAKKAVSAWDDYANDATALNLYRATSLYIVAYAVDPWFGTSPDGSRIRGNLLAGWRTTRTKPSYEYSRMGFIFETAFGSENPEELGIALLERDPKDAAVARAYIGMAMNRASNSRACALRCVELADKLVLDDPNRPANWMASARAYWVKAFAPGGGKGDVKKASAGLAKYESLIPADHPHREQLDLWKKGMANMLGKS